MLGIDTANEAIIRPLSTGLAAMRAARVLVRRVGPILTVNVVITNVELGEGTAGDLITNVSLGLGQPEQNVRESSEGQSLADKSAVGAVPVVERQTSPVLELSTQSAPTKRAPIKSATKPRPTKKSHG